MFDPVLKPGCEDIELGYRLSRHGLRVVYDARAVAMMARPVDYHGILQRLLRQGRSELVLSRKQPDHAVQRWAGVANAQSRWRELAAPCDAQVQGVGLLDTFAANAARYGLPVEDTLLRQLYDGYAWVLKATKLKSLIEDRQPAEFRVDFNHAYPVDGVLTPNWRERLVCAGCGLSNRVRAAIHVLEHIRSYPEALREWYRCLRPGAVLFFSVPFRKDLEYHLVRADVAADGSIVHRLAPEYHYDPIRPDGCLCFRRFAWELLDQLREVGFERAQGLLYWSRELGYLDGKQLLLTARREGLAGVQAASTQAAGGFQA